jgi:uncharacterized protein (TIGR01619 family)
MKKIALIFSTICAFFTNIASGAIVAQHEENWDFYLTNVNDKPSSIFLDLGYKKEVPVNGYDHIAWISVRLKQPDDNGMSSSGEMDTLNKIEDSIVGMMNTKYKSKYVGRLTGDGSRDFYFYIPTKDINAQDVKSAFQKFSTYEYQFGSKPDNSWNEYLNFLYPDPRQMQVMQNDHVLENLKSNGDQLTKARRVDHWVYFKNDESRHAFKDAVLKLNYSIQKEDTTDKRDSYKYMLQIYRVDHVDYNSINDVTLELFDLATKLDADYDGWETKVEK